MEEIPAVPQREWKPLPERVKICIFRFAFGMQEMSTTVDWIAKTANELGNHPSVEMVVTHCIADTPVDMCRNRALKKCLDEGYDFALFLDSDMWPDYQLKPGTEPNEWNVPFAPYALDFALKHDGPCVIGAPYCSAPPEERVLVMKWANKESNDPDNAFQLTSFTREEVCFKKGFEEVAALATGLLLIDVRALQALPLPWFSYQWKDAEQTEKASTEDIVFTRDLSILGVPQYCLWSAWAGHWKLKMVGKPLPMNIKVVPDAFRKTLWQEFNRQKVLQGK